MLGTQQAKPMCSKESVQLLIKCLDFSFLLFRAESSGDPDGLLEYFDLCLNLCSFCASKNRSSRESIT